MIDSFRWFGPGDPVPLSHIRQCGVKGVYTALHHIPYGEVWPREDIRERKTEIQAHGMEWIAVEPVPVSEAIKCRSTECDRHIENYCATLRNLGAENVNVVLNSFMPALEWLRTDLAYRLPDGKQCLCYNPAHLAAFDCFLLKRPGAEADYSARQMTEAETFFHALSPDDREAFGRKLCGLFPGIDLELSLDDLRERLAPYQGITPEQLKANLRYFLRAVVPAAEEAGVSLAMHPDDPPFSILGIPRISSTEADFREMIGMVDSPANGMCYCTGSLGASDQNEMVGIVERLGHRVNAVHLRNVERKPDGIFYEADHLGGSVDLPRVVKALLKEQDKRRRANRADWQFSYRPDHGHTMLDDLGKPMPPNPGYTCIGRMRGLAEVRGVQHGIFCGEEPQP